VDRDRRRIRVRRRMRGVCGVVVAAATVLPTEAGRGVARLSGLGLGRRRRLCSHWDRVWRRVDGLRLLARPRRVRTRARARCLVSRNVARDIAEGRKVWATPLLVRLCLRLRLLPRRLITLRLQALRQARTRARARARLSPDREEGTGAARCSRTSLRIPPACRSGV
jgi:hypothetical protein